MTVLDRRLFSRGLAVAALAPAAGAHAQTTYPSRAVKLVVPFPPGGGADFLGRLLAHKFSEALGQPMVVENKPGAATSIGSDAVAKAPPDGHTILMLLRDMSLNPSIMPSLPFDTLKSFAWIGKAVEGPFVLAANPAVPAKTLAEFVALAKQKPGTLTYGSLGVGGMAHVSFEGLMHETKMNLLHIPYKGAGPALQAVVSGEVSVALAALTGAVPFIREKRLVPLAVGSAKRAPQLPDVPTVIEAGGGDTVFPQYYALAAPAGTPQAIIDRLSTELKKIVSDKETMDRLVTNGLTPAYSTAEEFREEITTDVARFAKLIKDLNIKIQ